MIRADESCAECLFDKQQKLSDDPDNLREIRKILTNSQKEANSDRFLTKKGCGRIRILLDLFCTDYLIASNAASRAAIRSFTFSVPMERRIVFGLMP